MDMFPIEDSIVPSLDSCQSWCENCPVLRQELEAKKKEVCDSYTVLKQKIISTDEIIQKYHVKCRENDSKTKSMEDLSKKFHILKKDYDTVTNQLKSSLEEGEPLKTANARLEKKKAHLEKQVDEYKIQMESHQSIQKQLKEMQTQQEADITSLMNEKLKLRSKVKDLEANTKKMETIVKRCQEDLQKQREDLVNARKKVAMKGRESAKLKFKLEQCEEILRENGLHGQLKRLGLENLLREKVDSPVKNSSGDEKEDSSSERCLKSHRTRMEREEIENIFLEFGLDMQPKRAKMDDHLDYRFFNLLSPLPKSPCPIDNANNIFKFENCIDDNLIEKAKDSNDVIISQHSNRVDQSGSVTNSKVNCSEKLASTDEADISLSDMPKSIHNLLSPLPKSPSPIDDKNYGFEKENCIVDNSVKSPNDFNEIDSSQRTSNTKEQGCLIATTCKDKCNEQVANKDEFNVTLSEMPKNIHNLLLPLPNSSSPQHFIKTIEHQCGNVFTNDTLNCDKKLAIEDKTNTTLSEVPGGLNKSSLNVDINQELDNDKVQNTEDVQQISSLLTVPETNGKSDDIATEPDNNSQESSLLTLDSHKTLNVDPNPNLFHSDFDTVQNAVTEIKEQSDFTAIKSESPKTFNVNANQNLFHSDNNFQNAKGKMESSSLRPIIETKEQSDFTGIKSESPKTLNVNANQNLFHSDNNNFQNAKDNMESSSLRPIIETKKKRDSTVIKYEVSHEEKIASFLLPLESSKGHSIETPDMHLNNDKITAEKDLTLSTVLKQVVLREFSSISITNLVKNALELEITPETLWQYLLPHIKSTKFEFEQACMNQLGKISKENLPATLYIHCASLSDISENRVVAFIAGLPPRFVVMYLSNTAAVLMNDSQQVNLKSKSCLLRIYIRLCKECNMMQRLKVFLFDLIYNKVDKLAILLVNAAVVLPEVFTSCTDLNESPLFCVIQYIMYDVNLAEKGLGLEIVEHLWNNIDITSENIARDLFKTLKSCFLSTEKTTLCKAASEHFIFECTKSLEMLAIYKGWSWSKDVLFGTIVCPELQSCLGRKENRSQQINVYMCLLLKLIGSICTTCPLECLGSMLELVPVFSLICSNKLYLNSLPQSCQWSLIECFTRVTPFKHQDVIEICKQWFEQNSVCLDKEQKRYLEDYCKT